MKNGFTIIELMMTIFILSIVIAIGIPAFSVTTMNNRISSQTNNLLSTLNFARSEAVKLGSNITVCGSNNLTTCNTSSWEQGWIVFRDTNANATVDAGETILRVQEALDGGTTLRTSGFSSNANVQFDTKGSLGAVGTFIICDSRGALEAKAIVLNISGQARAATDENAPQDGIVNLHRTNNTLAGNVACP
jgi:type IV fimbrial biogenesis protein FimT